ncbi:polysaccharide export outer membrane protein [Granulicella rosea]|uniref:Polysaccharide export outer membrane protein n=1 Tax=Granulicella rosea TaxID=474952 RepID=A0A239HE68_9BACT|nr:polysaccharide biosynthesis/export family protein [Granulicella rosea]SNS79451.1 polysaccharide export outer membrane protein [Granulicella rosea]
MSIQRGVLSRIALTLAALLLTVDCRAQFSGPAFLSNSPANRAVVPTTDPAVLAAPSVDPQIGPGDLLSVTIFGVLSYAAPARVSVDGTVQLPLIGLVPVGGLPLHQAERLIATRLIDAGMYRNPQVTIQITESQNQTVTVTGELHAVIPVSGERHLLEILAATGPGPIPNTISRVITVLRPGLDQPIVVDLGTDPVQSAKANILIRPRDTIVLSHVGVVYVVGAFKTQGAIPLVQSSPLTLLEATSLSGGAGFEGKLSEVRIIRTFGAERRILPIDMNLVLKNKAPDPVLQADDIVILPSSAIRAAIKSNGINTLSSVASLLVVALQYH